MMISQNTLKSFLADERGASLVEYSLLLGLVSLAAVLTIAIVGGDVLSETGSYKKKVVDGKLAYKTKQEMDNEKKAKDDKIKKRMADRASAITKLKGLGLTENEREALRK